MKEVKLIPMFLCLHLFVYGNMILPCGSIEITSEGIINGIWILKDQSSVTLVCTIPPGTGLLIWRFNSSKVAECSVQSCRQISTDDGAFSFGFDTENGVYKWSISPVKIQKHNGQVFECNDGTNTKNVTAIVTESVMTAIPQNDTEKTSSHYSISLAGMILAAFADLFLLVVVCILGYNNLRKNTNEDKGVEMQPSKDLDYVKKKVDDTKQQMDNLITTVNSFDTKTTQINSNQTTMTTMDGRLMTIEEKVCRNGEKIVKIDGDSQKTKQIVEEIKEFQKRIYDDMLKLKGTIEKIHQDLREHVKTVLETANDPTQKERNLEELNQGGISRVSEFEK